MEYVNLSFCLPFWIFNNARAQRRRKVTQRVFNNKILIKTFSLFLLIFFVSILHANNNLEKKTQSNFDLAQVIRSIALIYTNDKLDPEVEEFLNYKQEIIWEDNAYVYLREMKNTGVC